MYEANANEFIRTYVGAHSEAQLISVHVPIHLYFQVIVGTLDAGCRRYQLQLILLQRQWRVRRV